MPKNHFIFLRSRHVSHLVSPLNTVLDDSIGCALWFAARGAGRLRPSYVRRDLEDSVAVGNEEDAYTTQAKVQMALI